MNQTDNVMNINIHKSDQDKRGAILIELALVIPLLTLILMASIFFGRVYKMKHDVSVTVGELAKEMFRECLAKSRGDATEDEACIRTIVELDVVTRSLPSRANTEFVVSIFQVSGGSVLDPAVVSRSADYKTSLDFDTKIMPNDTELDLPEFRARFISGINAQKRRAIVVESFTKTTLIDAPESFFNRDMTFYDVAVL